MEPKELSKTANFVQNARLFAKKLHQCLDETGASMHMRERTVILSKLLDIPKQQAWSLLEGQQFPDINLLEQIANEFEVAPQWFLQEN